MGSNPGYVLKSFLIYTHIPHNQGANSLGRLDIGNIEKGPLSTFMSSVLHGQNWMQIIYTLKHMNYRCRNATKPQYLPAVISRKFTEYFPVSNKNITQMYKALKNCAELKIMPKTQ